MSGNPFKIGDHVITKGGRKHTILKYGDLDGMNRDTHVILSNGNYCSIDYIKLDPEFHSTTTSRVSLTYQIDCNGETIVYSDKDTLDRAKKVLDSFNLTYSAFKVTTENA